MKQQLASFEVVKAIKEAGYPLVRYMTLSREQFEAGHGYKYSKDEYYYSESPSILHPEDNDTIDMYFRPTYIEIWLWLCKKKNFKFELKYNECSCCWHCYWDYYFECGSDPESAIVAAIEYLVTNNLIK